MTLVLLSFKVVAVDFKTEFSRDKNNKKRDKQVEKNQSYPDNQFIC